MEYTELINNRESVRNYDPTRTVPKEILEKILDAGPECGFFDYKGCIICCYFSS